MGDTISHQDAEDLLELQIKNDYLPHLRKIPYWTLMNDNQKSALISFAYNLGPRFFGSNGFKTISMVLREKRWELVPTTLELYRNPGTRVEKGLLRRRKAEGKLWGT